MAFLCRVILVIWRDTGEWRDIGESFNFSSKRYWFVKFTILSIRDREGGLFVEKT